MFWTLELWKVHHCGSWQVGLFVLFQVAVTPVSLVMHVETDVNAAASKWISSALEVEQWKDEANIQYCLLYIFRWLCSGHIAKLTWAIVVMPQLFIWFFNLLICVPRSQCFHCLLERPACCKSAILFCLVPQNLCFRFVFIGQICAVRQDGGILVNWK